MATPTTQGATAPVARQPVAQTQVPHDDGHHAAFPPFKPDSFGSQLLWLAITFGLLWAFMAKVGAPRVASILAMRRDQIEGDLSEAQRFKDQAANAEAAYDKALGDAKRGAAKLADETRTSLAAEFATKKEAEEKRLGEQLMLAEKRIGEVRDKALGEVDSIATDCAETIIARLTGAPTREDIGTAVKDVLATMERAR